MSISRSLLKLSSIVLLVTGATAALAQNADVPTALNGTYQAVYSEFSTGGPYAKNEKVTLVFNGDNDTICVGTNVYTNPVLKVLSGTSQVTFTDTAKGFYYSWNAAATTVKTEWGANIYRVSDSALIGQLFGTKASTATTCSGVPTTTAPAVSADVQSIFDLGTELFPAMFKNGSALGIYQDYVYKYFADSKIYVGIKDNSIYVMGGIYGNGITNKGSVSAVLSYLQSEKVRINTPVGNPIPTGLFKLTLSGTVKTSGFAAISIPVNVTINDLPAPSATDTNLIVNQVQTSLGVSGVANVKVVSVNNTASRVTFTVSFTATLSGLGAVSYDLTYDYTK